MVYGWVHRDRGGVQMGAQSMDGCTETEVVYRWVHKVWMGAQSMDGCTETLSWCTDGSVYV